MMNRILTRSVSALGAFVLTLAISFTPARADESAAPAPVTRTLANGLRVAVIQDTRLPIVDVQLLIPAGTRLDPPGQSGVAYLTSQLLPSGTTSRDASTMTDEIDKLGGRLLTNADRDYATIAGAFLAREFESGLEIISDMAINPVFPENEFSRVKRQALGNAIRMRRDPSSLADAEIWSLVFGDHPYGHVPYGEVENVNALGREAIRDFFRDHYRPDRATLAIAGDVTPERAFAAAEEWFGRWSGKSAAARTPEPKLDAGAHGRPAIRIVDVPGLNGAEIRVGCLAPAKAAADMPAMVLANAVLGNGPGSRLGRLKSRGALLAPPRSAIGTLESGGIVTCMATAREDSAAAVIALLQAQLARFVAAPPSDQELRDARRYLRDSQALDMETLASVLASWSEDQFYALPAERGSDARAAESATAAEVRDAAARWLAADRVKIVVVGSAARLKPRLERLGEVTVIEALPAPSTAASAPTLPPPTSEEIARGRELLDQAIAAHGGLEKLRAIKDSKVVGELTLTAAGREVTGKLVQIRKDPYKMVFSTSFPEFSGDQVLNGSRGWMISNRDNAQLQDMDTLAVAGMRNGFGSDLPHLLLGAHETGATVASRGREKVDQSDADVLEVSSAGQRKKLYFDATSHRLIAMELSEGLAGNTRRIYGDYRSVNGIQWPHLEERYLNGERVMKIALTQVTLDSGVDDAMFEKPEAELAPPSR